MAVAGLAFFILGGIIGKFDWTIVANGVWKIVAVYIGIEGVGDIKSR